MRILVNLLLGFQLEGYHAGRFLALAYGHPRFLIETHTRQQLVWTWKVRLITLITIAIEMILIAIGVMVCGWGGGVAVAVVCILLVPVVMVGSTLVLVPVDSLARMVIIVRARRRLRTWHGTRVIGIAGSYGKTSQKEILTTILSEGLSVLAPEGTLNTPIGIARTILGAVCVPDVFIVEMGEHYRGDVRELGRLVRPSIGIITGITEQHLERMGSIDTIIDTIFELAESLPSGAVCYMDARAEYIQRGMERCRHLSVRYEDTSLLPVDGIEYLPDFAGMRWMYRRYTVTTPLLGRHTILPIVTAWEIARSLGMDDVAIVRAVGRLRPIPHRLELIHNTDRNIFVIDDGFNGNIEGVRATVQLFKHVPFAGRRIYITPGLVELGDQSDTIHREVGRLIAEVFDIILLIDTSATRSIRTGLREAGYPETRIIVYPDTPTAHEKLGSVLQSGDAIVFQNDWTDNYR